MYQKSELHRAKTFIVSLIAASFLVAGVGISSANAYPGPGPAEYCSSSNGCVGQIKGKNVYAHPAIKLTSAESKNLQKCQYGIVGFVTSAISANPWTIAGASINGLLNTYPACKALGDSLHKRGVK